MTVAGEVAGGVYGGCDYPVRGNTSVTVSGTWAPAPTGTPACTAAAIITATIRGGRLRGRQYLCGNY